MKMLLIKELLSKRTRRREACDEKVSGGGVRIERRSQCRHLARELFNYPRMIPVWSLLALLDPSIVRAAEGKNLGAAEISGESSLNLDIEKFVQLVIENHPVGQIESLESARLNALEPGIGRLPDPQISIGRENIPFPKANAGSHSDVGADAGAGDPMVSKGESNASRVDPVWKFTISQGFPWPGTNAARQEVAEKERLQRDANIQLLATFRNFDARELYYQLVATARLIEIEKENLDSATLILKNAESRLRYGLGTHHDLVQAQNEKAILALNYSATKADLSNLKDDAAQWIGRQDAAGIEFQMKYGTGGESDISSKPFADLRRLEIEKRSETEVAKISARRLETWPQLMAQGMLMQSDDGMMMYGAMAGVAIPIFSNRERNAWARNGEISGDRRQIEISWHDKRKNLATVKNQRRREAVMALLRTLREEVIPNSREHLKSLSVEYAQGKGDFEVLNSARQALLRFRQREILAERELALADLEKSRIEVGFYEGELSMPMPQLALDVMNSAMGGGMGQGSGSTMGGNLRSGGGMPDSRTTRSMKSGANLGDDSMDDSPESKGDNSSGGMGGM